MQPDHLAKGNASRHTSIFRRTIKAIEELRESGRPVSFYSVAKEAQVARSTLYRNDDLKRLVEEARNGKQATGDDATEHHLRIKALEEELAQVTAERNELAQTARNNTAAIHYGSVGMIEAA